MKHVMADTKSLLTGDDVADLLIRYAVLLSQIRSADSVEIAAIESFGNASRVTLLLNNGSSLTSESADSDMQEPDNAKAEEYITSRITEIERERYPSIEDIIGTDDHA